MSKDKDFVEEPSKDPEAAKSVAATEMFADVSEDAAEQPILSAAEVEKIKQEAKDKILAERKSAAKADLMAREIQRLKNEEGLVTGNSHSDEIVNITIDLPTFAPSIVVNMRPYWHGQTYPVPRHVADSLRSQMFSSWKHQNEIDGKSLSQFYANRRITELTKVAKAYVPDPYRPGKVAPATIAKVG